MRRSVSWRGFAVLWAVLQFALPGVALLADARLERESMQAPGAHVESGTTKACRAVHPDQCALCQFLSRVAPPAAGAPLPAIASIVRPSADAPLPERASRDLATAALPRAPPAVA